MTDSSEIKIFLNYHSKPILQVARSIFHDGNLFKDFKWNEFEWFCAQLFILKGYKITQFNPVLDYKNPEFDNGIDFIATKDNEIAIVQCKKSEYGSGSPNNINQKTVLYHLGIVKEYEEKNNAKAVGYFYSLTEFWDQTQTRFKNNDSLELFDVEKIKEEIEKYKFLDWKPDNYSKDSLIREIESLNQEKNILLSEVGNYTDLRNLDDLKATKVAEIVAVSKKVELLKETQSSIQSENNILVSSTIFWKKLWTFVAFILCILFFFGFSNNFGRVVSKEVAQAESKQKSVENDYSALINKQKLTVEDLEKANIENKKLTEENRDLKSTELGIEVQELKDDLKIEKESYINLQNELSTAKQNFKEVDKSYKNLLSENQADQLLAQTCDFTKFKETIVSDNSLERTVQKVSKNPLKYTNLKYVLESSNYYTVTYDWKPCLKDIF